jgi:hypothetical protein
MSLFKKINTKDNFIYLLIVIFILLIAFSIKSHTTMEAFGVKDIGKLGKKIGDVDKKLKSVEKFTKTVPNEIKKINKQVKDVETFAKKVPNEIKKMEKQIKEVEKKTTQLVSNKLKSVFTQIGNILKKGLIDPIIALFVGIGKIFVQIFYILQEIGNKIVSLPNCTITYIIKSIFDTIHYMYNKIIPRFIRKPLGFIYHYTLRYIVDFIDYLFGYSKRVEKCYKFDIDSQVKNINSNLNNINKSFTSNFGKIDFSKIKV